MTDKDCCSAQAWPEPPKPCRLPLRQGHADARPLAWRNDLGLVDLETVGQLAIPSKHDGCLKRWKKTGRQFPQGEGKRLPAGSDTELQSRSNLWQPQALACACTGETPVPPIECEMV